MDNQNDNKINLTTPIKIAIGVVGVIIIAVVILIFSGVFNQPVIDTSGQVQTEPTTQDVTNQTQGNTEEQDPTQADTNNPTDASTQGTTNSQNEPTTQQPTDNATTQTQPPTQSNTTATDPTTVVSQTVNINGENYKKGDTLTYSVSLSDVEPLVCGLESQIFYDSDILEIVENSINFPNLSSVIYNDNVPNNPNMITFNWVSLSGVDFSTSNVLVEVTFEIKDTSYSSTEISFALEDLIDYDGNPLASQAKIEKKIK